MLPKSSRLSVSNAFQKKTLRTVRGQYFTIKIFPAEKSSARFGIAIGKGTAKLATERNAIKRLFFNTVRLLASFETYDYLCIAGKNLGEISLKAIKIDLESIMKQYQKRVKD